MNNLEKYNQIFKEIFLLDDNVSFVNLSKTTMDNWDSVRQLALVSGIEEAFDILLDSEDILNITSYPKGIDLLLKYGISI